jgi:hypothetical protein
MQQTYEFYIVDPATWKNQAKLDCITSCDIDRDSSAETLGSASFESTKELDECYIRTYLVANQNGVIENVPLGTHLVQTPSSKFDGKLAQYPMDAFTPLIELKDSPPPIGYSLLKGQKIMDLAYTLCQENMRAPVVRANNDDNLDDNFVANLNDNWLTFIRDFIGQAKYKLGLDEMGQVIFEKIQDWASQQHVWTYTDNNSSILYPDITDDRDLYGIPNVVEVVYSTETKKLFSRVVNDDPSSPISTVSRGREVVKRISNPNFSWNPTQEYLDEYAKQTLKNLSCLEHTITYSHGYCPVRVGDCVLLNYERAGLRNVRAVVISQSIKCTTGCPVEETAVYTTTLWR